MTSGVRVRVIVLQVGLIALLVFGAGFLRWGNGFAHGMIREQLSAQQIFFPPAGSEALGADVYPELQQYGGMQVDDGVKAEAYANGYIGRHLDAVAGGKTYSQVSTASRANPGDAALRGQVETLFRGETLRGLLLNAYGWWTVGQYALYASMGLAAAAVVVAGALVFELVLLRRSMRVGDASHAGVVDVPVAAGRVG